LEAVRGASILHTALNFFFELAFLEVAILLEVFLSECRGYQAWGEEEGGGEVGAVGVKGGNDG
jgi:hypothetical protein